MIYLCSPYTHPDHAIRHARFVAACQAAAALMAQGARVFSPIAHSYAIEQVGGLNGDWAFWSQIDYEWIRLCGAVWVLALAGWDRSVGVTAELRYAQSLQLAKPRIITPAELGIADVPIKEN